MADNIDDLQIHSHESLHPNEPEEPNASDQPSEESKESGQESPDSGAKGKHVQVHEHGITPKGTKKKSKNFKILLTPQITNKNLRVSFPFNT